MADSEEKEKVVDETDQKVLDEKDEKVVDEKDEKVVDEKDEKVVDEKDEGDNSKDGESKGIPAGAILENGEINWDCPCMGGFQNGPCGQSFRDSFSCFIQSKAETKGSDCYEQMREWSQCMQDNAEYYNNLKENNDDDDDSDKDDDDDKNDDDDSDKDDDNKSS